MGRSLTPRTEIKFTLSDGSLVWASRFLPCLFSLVSSFVRKLGNLLESCPGGGLQMNLKTLVANLRRDANELEELDNLLRGIGGASTSNVTSISSGKGKRTLSAKARAAISRAQKARWAKVRAGKK